MEEQEDELIQKVEHKGILTEYYESGKQIKRNLNGEIIEEKILTEKDYYFPTEIPNRYPDKKYLNMVDRTLKVNHFRTALANLYEVVEKRWDGGKGFDDEIERLQQVCKERINRTIDLEGLPKVKPSLQN